MQFAMLGTTLSENGCAPHTFLAPTYDKTLSGTRTWLAPARTVETERTQESSPRYSATDQPGVLRQGRLDAWCRSC